VKEISELNLVDANITTVIWATGYSFDFSLVQLPVFDRDGYPIQKRGVSDYPGLYFVGLPWLHDARSGLLFGLAQDAGHIAAVIDEEARHSLAGSRKKQDETRFKYESPAAGQSENRTHQLPSS